MVVLRRVLILISGRQRMNKSLSRANVLKPSKFNFVLDKPSTYSRKGYTRGWFKKVRKGVAGINIVGNAIVTFWHILGKVRQKTSVYIL